MSLEHILHLRNDQTDPHTGERLPRSNHQNCCNSLDLSPRLRGQGRYSAQRGVIQQSNVRRGEEITDCIGDVPPAFCPTRIA